MGDKIRSKKLAKSAGVNIVPGDNSILEDVSNAEETAKKIGYPVILKASAGGGGKGIRVINDKDEFASKEKTIKEELRNSFNESDLYIEKYINVYKHIEIQLIADKYGNISALPERDCSCQRKYQKFLIRNMWNLLILLFLI